MCKLQEAFPWFWNSLYLNLKVSLKPNTLMFVGYCYSTGPWYPLVRTPFIRISHAFVPKDSAFWRPQSEPIHSVAGTLSWHTRKWDVYCEGGVLPDTVSEQNCINWQFWKSNRWCLFGLSGNNVTGSWLGIQRAENYILTKFQTNDRSSL